MRPSWKFLISACVAGLLGGCVGSSDYTDLQAYMDEVDGRPKGRIDPLPPFEQVPPFAYQASAMRSPFEPPVLVKKIDRPEGGPQVKPDINRVKQFLEQYTIAQLAMVGTLSQVTSMYGLVQDPDGGVHRVKKGDYMGTDYGKIIDIDEAAIELIEIVSDGTGGWVERSRRVALSGQG